ncbi:hypothetical protein ACQKMD_13805 [Viridibacillus sp. NPDC096237]|uniref:hypothetical protein n=1 Tax=Viridibacillus sp. NPDC096237 TaxID=3390721 RepID=UPI003D037BDE
MSITAEMKQKMQIESQITDLLIGEPLFEVIRDTPMELALYNDSYLAEIFEKRFYSTAEVAGWFGISDAQLRYYIKPFQEYIFPHQEDTPSTASFIRLSFLGVLKLRMILLLKDEYRVKGLKRLLGIDEEGRINPQPHHTTGTDVIVHDNLAQKVEILSNVLNQILQTGIFELQQEDGEPKISLNNDFSSQKLNITESSKQIKVIEEKTEQLIKDNEKLHNQIRELNDFKVKDIAVKMRERHIENAVVSQLRDEALVIFNSQKTIGIFKNFLKLQKLKEKKNNSLQVI